MMPYSVDIMARKLRVQYEGAIYHVTGGEYQGQPLNIENTANDAVFCRHYGKEVASSV
jgi:hypothetical protein